MSTQTILLIVLAAIVALVLSVFQYYFKAKRAKINPILAFLRFVTLLAGFLLLINPKLVKEDFEIEKANLVLLFDASSSIEKLGGKNDASTVLSTLQGDDALSDRFSVQRHFFGNGLLPDDSLLFNAGTTNLTGALHNLREVYGTSKSTYVVVTDGNQNIGADYEHIRLGNNAVVYPIVVGDTTAYEDLYLSQVNVNRYTFLKNQFPFEANLGYAGDKAVATRLNIYLDGQRVFQENIRFSELNSTKTVQGVLKANTVGLKSLGFELQALEGEKNTSNNQKQLAIEVIDEQTKVALIASILHPDLGALKKSIEANEQRSVTILKPNAPIENLEGFDFYILYQPNRSFANVFDLVQKKNAGSFIITGLQTDWSFLGNAQNVFSKETFGQSEEVLPNKNVAFGVYDISGVEMANYPPLSTQLGELEINIPYETVLWQQIRGISLETPLLFTFSREKARHAVLLGENLWQWRAQTYREHRNFEGFDNFMEQLVRYLSDSKPKNRLELTYEAVYNTPSNARIRAAFFDETYNFDPEASLVLRLKKDNENTSQEIPMLLRASNFEADLSNLAPGDYGFTVLVEKKNISRSGKFSILDFNLEDQLVSANAGKLRRFAKNNHGQAYHASQLTGLIERLLQEQQFRPVQKSIKNVVSLIDFKVLLIIMAFSLSLEWFIRKYNGLL